MREKGHAFCKYLHLHKHLLSESLPSLVYEEDLCFEAGNESLVSAAMIAFALLISAVSSYGGVPVYPAITGASVNAAGAVLTLTGSNLNTFGGVSSVKM